jgi:putative oxidoreductase
VRAGRLIASSPREVERVRDNHGRSEGENRKVQRRESERLGANDRTPGTRIFDGGTRGTEALRVLRGPGLEGTSGFMEMLGMRPGRPWAYLAGLSEFGGGVLTALGLFNPLGPLGIIASISMATRKAHWGKPIWVTEGGAELPVLNIAISTALMIREPDGFSLDRLLGIRLPRWVGLVGLVGVILTMLYAELGAEEAPEQEQAHEEAHEEEAQDEAREELAGP